MPYIHLKIGSENEQPLIFDIDEAVTVRELKQKLEGYLKIPVAHLHLQTCERAFVDADMIARASSHSISISEQVISLYNDATFMGFVRVLNDKPVDQAVDVADSDMCCSSSDSLLAIDSNGDLMNEQSDEYLKDTCGTIKCEPKPRCAPKPSCASSTTESLDDEVDGEGQAPFVNVLPENRQFILVVSAPCQENYFCDLLKEFFDIFINDRKVSQLKFNEKTPVIEFAGKLYIVPADEDTMEFVENGVKCIGGYKATPLIDFLHLSLVRFVWPGMESCLLNNLKLLESQNDCLHTDKWAVVERILVKPNDPRWLDGSVCDNEEIVAFIDIDSIAYIKERCNQLRFCFWMLTFEFC